MKKFVITSLRFYVITMVLIIGTTAFAQSDSALNRSVTVERDFQPVIQAAGKISTRPAVVETTIEPAPVEYSTYTADVTPEAAIQPMLSQPTRYAAVWVIRTPCLTSAIIWTTARTPFWMSMPTIRQNGVSLP